MNVTIGSAPDSWGIWFPDDPMQTPWHRFLDEIAEAGYEWTELGPTGYLPTDYDTLKPELDKRGLKVSGSFIMPHLEDKEAWPSVERWLRNVGELLQKFEARYLVVIDDTYSNLFTGEHYRVNKLDDDGWERLIETTTKICRIARDDYGLTGVYHHHAETHVEYPEDVERLLRDTDPDLVSLCLDTGHYEYRYGDSVELMRKHHDRIPYLHLKSVEADKRDEVHKGNLSFAEAVANDMFVEPKEGVVDFEAFRDVLEEINYEGFGIVEQDMYPAPFDKPLPIATRTRAYLREIGIG
jgi:inosose dehydratase